MSERRAVVDQIEGDQVRLRALERCSDCGGCGGRCDLFRSASGDELQLPRDCFEVEPMPGQRVRLLLDDRWLRQTAWRVYGLATLGLLVGAALGWLAGRWLNVSPDISTLIGASCGTLLAIRGSKTRLPEISVVPADGRSQRYSQVL